jgi:acyl-coenzyme A thioesterase PaaI-like protein
MSGLPFALPADRLLARLAGFHARREIGWFGLQGRFDAPDSAVVRLARFEPGYLGGGGTDALNGGLIASGFDAVCVLAALGHVDTEVVATLTLQVQYLRLAEATPGLEFRAQALKVARHVVFVQAVLADFDRDRGPAATAHATLAPLRRAPRVDAPPLAA